MTDPADEAPVTPEPAPETPDGADVAPGSDAAARRRPRPTARGVAAWLALAVGAAVLGGGVGAAAAVAVGAVRLAGLGNRLLAGVGLLALVAVPVTVVVEGIPSAAEVGPWFVSRSLLAHHLTFLGLLLVGAAVAGDLAPSLRRNRTDDGDDVDPGVPHDPVGGPLGASGPVVRIAVAVVALVLAVVASAAVLVS